MFKHYTIRRLGSQNHTAVRLYEVNNREPLPHSDGLSQIWPICLRIIKACLKSDSEHIYLSHPYKAMFLFLHAVILKGKKKTSKFLPRIDLSVCEKDLHHSIKSLNNPGSSPLLNLMARSISMQAFNEVVLHSHLTWTTQRDTID